MPHTPTLRFHLFGLFLLAFTIAPAAFAATVVIPNAQETVEGNETNAFPFTRTQTSNEPYRYQQVYDATGFGAQEAPITIDEIRFRPDSNNFEPAAILVQSIEVRLSTTQRSANCPSPPPDCLDNVEFNNNIGADAALVYSGPFTLPIPTVTAQPRPFEVAIPLAPQFVYDPAAGNLLVEVYNLSETIELGYTLDTHNLAGDEISRVVEVVIPGTEERLIPPVGTGSRGLVTQFVYNTPEADTLGAGVAALFALFALRRTRSA